MTVDLLANVERPPTDRPVRIPPPLPDLESTAPYWYGPAGADAAQWRARALASEGELRVLRRQLARYRGR